MLVQMERRLWTVQEYHAMAETGILREEDRVELVEGEIIAMSPIGVRHMACVNLLTDVFNYHFRGAAIVSVQNAVRLNNQSEPEPDVVLLKYRDDYYAQQMPTAVDVLLLVEVADSTVPYDRSVKRPLYARAGITEYWLINLVDNSIEIHRQPQDGVYQEMRTYYKDDVVTAVAFSDTEFKVTDLIR